MTAFNEFFHVAIEECQSQGHDVTTVHIRVSEQDDFSIAEFGDTGRQTLFFGDARGQVHAVDARLARELHDGLDHPRKRRPLRTRRASDVGDEGELREHLGPGPRQRIAGRR